MQITRLRQVVVAAADRDAIQQQWARHFDLGAGYSDPGVGEFGLHNWVVPVGEDFLEVVAPTREGTPAGRYRERHGGDAGYMVLFQVADIAAAREHLRQNQCRTVWNCDLPEISGTHLHPADLGGAIVSVDEARPPPSWHWAGPQWRAQARTGTVAGLAGITLADADPAGLMARWSRLLRLQFREGLATLPDGCAVRIVDAASRPGAASGLVAAQMRATRREDAGRSACIAGTDFELV